MDDIAKILKKLIQKDREKIEELIQEIISRNWKHLNIKKLKGHNNIYRVRKGDIRIIFLDINGDIRILSISTRNENTYKDY